MLYTDLLERSEYSFIRENEHLGKNIILLGFGGSISYGTDNPYSDIDVRGITLNRKPELIGLEQFEQDTDEGTDTVIYGLMKIMNLLMNCNPNTIELLGLKPQHYLILSDIGKQLIENTDMFLSKRAIQSFGGYADAQLRRLQNALARDSLPQQEKEKHIFNSVRNAMYHFNAHYKSFESGALQIYIDQSEHPDFETEIFVDASLKHYPLRDYRNMWQDMSNIVREYDKLGKRNKKKDDNHLNKHAMHLIRLFMMGIDILEKGKVNTYRGDDLELLLRIRNGEMRTENGFSEEFYDLVADYEKKLHYAAENTTLPDEPDRNRISEFVMSVNERVVRDEI